MQGSSTKTGSALGLWEMSTAEVLLLVGALFPWVESVQVRTPGGDHSQRGPSLQLSLL